MKVNEEGHPDRHQVQMEGKSVAICRCWRSKSFPYCDGAHRKFNEENKDKTGPAIVQVEKK